MNLDYSTKPRISAILQAFLVTFLWSTSWILIKKTQDDALPALTFAGLRYTAAFLCLVPWVLFNPSRRKGLFELPYSNWWGLLIFGLVCYTVAQGALFIALQYIPATMISLLLNLSPVAVGLAGILILQEYPTNLQWVGILAATTGIFVYFASESYPSTRLVGFLAAIICMLANAGSSIFGRFLNSRTTIHPLLVTFVSMGFGASILLLAGLIIQGLGAISMRQFVVIGCLAIINTALAWSLWNHSLRTLTALEASVLGSLMLPQTAVLAVFFLGEELTLKHILGLILVGLGAFVVQIKRKITNYKGQL